MAEVTTVEYFEDFGRRRAQYSTTVISMLGMNDTSHSVQIWADGYEIKFDPATKEGTRFRLVDDAPTPSPSGMPDIARMSRDQMMSMDMEELEPRQIAGRQAAGMAMTVAGMKMRAWTWNGILLRSETDMGGSEPTVTEVTKLELGVPVPAERFQVPADVKLTDL